MTGFSFLCGSKDNRKTFNTELLAAVAYFTLFFLLFLLCYDLLCATSVVLFSLQNEPLQ